MRDPEYLALKRCRAGEGLHRTRSKIRLVMAAARASAHALLTHGVPGQGAPMQPGGASAHEHGERRPDAVGGAQALRFPIQLEGIVPSHVPQSAKAPVWSLSQDG